MAREGHTFEFSEETSDADDDFVLESLPDTEELDEEDEGDGLDSEEQPYEAETGFLDTPCSAADGGSSVVGGSQAEVSEHANEQLRRSKRRKLSTGAAASNAAATSEQAASTLQPQHQSWQQQQQQQHHSSSVGAASHHPHQEGSLRPPKPRTPLQQQKQQQHGMQLRHHLSAAGSAAPAAVVAAAAGPEAPRLPRQQPVGQHSQPGLQDASQHSQPRRQHEQLMQSPGRNIQQQHRAQQQSQPSSNHPGSAFTTSEAAAAGAAEDAASVRDDSQGAICYRTRSKHPLAAEEFDPDMFDRLLAEFDPDVEPLMDDAMYQQFLQSLQGDGPTGSLVPAGLEPISPGTAAAAAAVAAAAGPGAGIAAAGDPAAAAAAGGAGGAVQGDDEDESDEEFQLDPLDWLLDDERDAAEEEVLAQLVHLQAHQTGAEQQQQQQHAAAAAAARRRSQRKAAQRAAEMIARSQQQQQQQQVQVAPGGVATGTGQPHTPVTADGVKLAISEPVHHEAQLQMQLQYAGGDPSIAAQQQQQQQLRMSTAESGQAAAAVIGQLGGPHVGMSIDLQQPNPVHALAPVAAAADEAVPETAAAAAADVGSQMPDLLTLKDTQLQQLYHQVTLHTQLLTQLYALTAKDPSPSSQAIASSAGQMLEQLRRLHAAATGSYRGQQLAQLLQQAFNVNMGPSIDAVHAQEQQQQHCTPQKQRQPGQYITPGASGGMMLEEQQHGDSGSSGGADGKWRPAFKDISTIWDSQPLRQLDAVAAALQQLPTPKAPMWDAWDPENATGTDAEAAAAAGDGSRRRWGYGSSMKAAAQKQQQRALKELRQVLEASLGPHRSCCIVAAWPLLAPRTRSTWTPHEDDLMWLGIVRFHTAISPMQDTAELIAQELLPCKSPAVILNRYKNQVKAKSPTAVLLLSYALLGKERPAAWGGGSDDSSQHSDDDQQQQQQGAWAGAHRGQGSRPGEGLKGVSSRRYKAAALRRRIPRGPMWAAAELGAALTVAFASVQTGAPSAAAAAAAGVLLQDTAAAAEDADSPAAAAAAAAAGAPAAVCAGQQLLVDLVAAVSARLPFGLPAALDIPSAASMRRQQARHGANRPAAAAAGEHLLLSLAARQLLQGPEEDSGDVGDEQLGDAQSEGGSAAAAAGSGGRAGGLGGLLGSVFATGAGDGSADDGLGTAAAAAAAGVASSPPPAAAAAAAAAGRSAARVQATPVKSYVALLQESPLPPRQLEAAAGDAAAAAAVRVTGAKRAVTFALPGHQMDAGIRSTEALQEHAAGPTAAGEPEQRLQAGENGQQRQQQTGSGDQAEDGLDLDQLLDHKIEQQLQQRQQQRQQGGSQQPPPAMSSSSSMLDGMQLQHQDVQGEQQPLLQPSQQARPPLLLLHEGANQGLVQLPDGKAQQLPCQTTALCMLGNSPTSGGLAKQQQQQHLKILSAREIAQQLQQLQHGQQQGLAGGVAVAAAAAGAGNMSTGLQAAAAAVGTGAKKVRKSLFSNVKQPDSRGNTEDAATAAAAAAPASKAMNDPVCFGIGLATDSWYQPDCGQQQQQQQQSKRTGATAAAAAAAAAPGLCWIPAGDKTRRRHRTWQVAPNSLAAAGLAGCSGPTLLPQPPSDEPGQGSNAAAMQQCKNPLPSSSGGVGLSLGFGRTAEATAAAAAQPEEQQQQQRAKVAKPKKKHFSRKFVRTQPLPPVSDRLTVAAARRFAELTAAQAHAAVSGLGGSFVAHVAVSGLGGSLVASTPGIGGSLAVQETAGSTKMTAGLNQLGTGAQLIESRQGRGAGMSTAAAAAAAGGSAVANAAWGAAIAAPPAAVPGLSGGAMVAPAAAAVAGSTAGKGRRIKQPAKGTPHRKLAAAAAAAPLATTATGGGGGGGKQGGGAQGSTGPFRLQQLPPRVPHSQQQQQQQQTSVVVGSHFSGLAALAEAAAVAERRGRQ